MSDDEVQEGQIREAVQACTHHGIEVRGIMDVDDQQRDGAMSRVMEVGDIRTRFTCFGAVCVEVDGHDLHAIRQANREVHKGRPLIILARTSPFRTMSILAERFPRLHHVRFTAAAERAPFNVSISRDLGTEPIDYAH